MRHARVVCAIVGVVATTGCGLLLSIDDYRACVGSECDASTETSTDTSTDMSADAPGLPCAASSDCSAADGRVVCSNQRCVAVDSLAEGSANLACAVLHDQTMWCWGDNSLGQLGRGAKGGPVDVPAPVSSSLVADPIVRSVIGNDYACALTAPPKRAVWCWGDGAAGGGGPTSVQVNLPSQATALSGGPTGACAQITNGSVYCWGRNETGNLGCGDAGPLQVSPLAPRLLVDMSAGTAEIAAGGYTTCVRQGGSDTVRCFGNDSWGGLGDGKPDGSAVNCLSATISGFAKNELQSITAADNAVCARDIDGYSFCWGQNYDFNGAGIVWPGNPAGDLTTPFQMPIPTTTQQISIGWLHTCILDQSGAVTCWGESSHGTASKYATVAFPTVVPGVDANAIASHRQFTCALEKTGRVVCWGDNEFLTVGPHTLGTDTKTPTPIVWP